MGNVIFILLDACGYDAGTYGLGYPEHLTEAGQIAKYRVQGELPSISRPMYETLMTGVPVYRHGVTNNTVTRASICDNLFSLCRKAGKTTAAAAYMWMSELYNGRVYHPETDRFQFAAEGGICDGIFYSEDGYPDSHVFMDADYLLCSKAPNFLMVHPMGIDFAGHEAGSNSSRFHNAVAAANQLLAIYLPKWRAMGYDVVVTADHGMDEMGIHGGPAEIQRQVPLYILSDAAIPGDYTEKRISQLEIAPLLCRLLGLAPAAAMRQTSEIAFSEK